MAAQIDVCTPFSHCENTKPSVQVFFLLLLCFCFFLLFAPVRVVSVHACVHVCVPGYCCGGTVARTNHYLVVVGLERSAVWNVRLCSTGARCSRALLKCPIKEGRVRFEWICVWEWLCMHVWKKDRVLCVMWSFPSLCVHQICTKCKVYIHWITCVTRLHSS